MTLTTKNYWGVRYVFQDTKFKKKRLKCFHLGFEYKVGLNSAQRVAEEHIGHYASK
jgi:hypothetical protein